jgi:4-amino-4-deoxy-L-arabinose transferase-like glycosyltransferase
MAISPGLWNSGKRAILIGVLVTVILVATAGNIGVTRDEPAYIAASQSYSEWFHRLVFGPHGILNRSVIDASWSVNNEHPPFDKILSGVVWGLTNDLLSDLLAHRLANMLLFGVMAAFLYHMVADELGDWSAIGTIAALLTMPRLFFHAHLAALDVPAAGMIVIVTYVFWRTKESARFRYTILLGLVWGLAIATKINAAFVLPTLFLWALIFRRKFYILLRLALCTLIGLPVFIGIWPWLYYETVARVEAFLSLQTVSPWEIPQYYLHKIFMTPPWHFPFVMLVAVVPLGTCIVSGLGTLRGFLRRRDRAFVFLLVFNALVPLLLVAAGQTMVYDNERLFMPAFPFLAALAGSGFGWIVKSAGALFVRFRIPKFLTPIVVFAAACVVWIPPILSMITFSPYWLSYYSETVGGLPGAAKLGLETTYWCESYHEAVLYINANAQPGDTIWAPPSTVDVLVYYQMQGILRKDVVLASSTNLESVFGSEALGKQAVEDFSDADFVVIQQRESLLYDQAGQPTEVLAWTSARTPAFRVQRAGTPILDIYTNP